MATICPYCNIEVSESAIEAEDGCCPECGSVISGPSDLMEAENDDYYDDYDDLGDEFDDDDDDFLGEDDYGDDFFDDEFGDEFDDDDDYSEDKY